jgi:hypothetical protein
LIIDDIREQLISDLDNIGLPTDFTLDLKQKYSKSYKGRYFSREKKVTIYAVNRFGDYRGYQDLLETAIHEAIHHYQYHHQEGFIRKKGVMHNIVFKKLYEQYTDIARKKGLIVD